MKNTTILNSNYTHLKVVSWKRGMKLCMADKVTVVEYYQDYEIMSGSGEKFQVPKVVVLKRYIKLPDRMYRPNRRNIFLRDNYTCVYCLRQLETNELSIDHILPKSRGGKETWENLTTACKSCNCLKGDRTPEEAKLTINRS
jgi:5-methylcytosine-specific restriction endonuclease McrA